MRRFACVLATLIALSVPGVTGAGTPDTWQYASRFFRPGPGGRLVDVNAMRGVRPPTSRLEAWWNVASGRGRNCFSVVLAADATLAGVPSRARRRWFGVPVAGPPPLRNLRTFTGHPLTGADYAIHYSQHLRNANSLDEILLDQSSYRAVSSVAQIHGYMAQAGPEARALLLLDTELGGHAVNVVRKGGITHIIDFQMRPVEYHRAALDRLDPLIKRGALVLTAGDIDGYSQGHLSPSPPAHPGHGPDTPHLLGSRTRLHGSGGFRARGWDLGGVDIMIERVNRDSPELFPYIVRNVVDTYGYLRDTGILYEEPPAVWMGRNALAVEARTNLAFQRQLGIDEPVRLVGRFFMRISEMANNILDYGSTLNPNEGT